jgi:hypothetical protein
MRNSFFHSDLFFCGSLSARAARFGFFRLSNESPLSTRGRPVKYLLIASRMTPAVPDEIRVRTVRVCALVTALCRTCRLKPVKCRPGIHPGVTMLIKKITPDPVHVLSGGEEFF